MAVSHVKSSPVADFTGTVTALNSQGSTTTLNATDLVRPSDWNSQHNQFVTISGDTLGASTWSGTNLVFAGASGVRLSVNGNTLSFIDSNTAPLSRYYFADGITTPPIAVANSIVSINQFRVREDISASAMGVHLSVLTATAANTSSAGWVLSASCVFYTRNGSSLSSFNSGSYSVSTFHQSNSGASVGGIREIVIPLATASQFGGGAYWVALHLSSATTSSGAASWTSLGKTMSVGVVPNASAWHLIGNIGSGTNSTNQFREGVGIISTGATRGSIGFSIISGNGNTGVNAAYVFNLQNYAV